MVAGQHVRAANVAWTAGNVHVQPTPVVKFSALLKSAEIEGHY